MTKEKFNELGARLSRILTLRYSPIAMKLVFSEDEIPEGTHRPHKDKGEHLAMCQAFALVRRNRMAVTMLREDHWCVWPLISYRHEKLDSDDVETVSDKFFMANKDDGRRHILEEYPMLKDREPLGFTIAPLESCAFEPEIICIYCRPAQVRTLMMAAKYKCGKMFDLTMDAVDSCVYSTIPVLNGQSFNVTFPDPGEYERALADEDEVMFTFRAERLEDIMSAIEMLHRAKFDYQGLVMDMTRDFARPPFYEALFKKWGLDSGEMWQASHKGSMPQD